MGENLKIEGQEIAIKQVNEQDYLSLTDIARYREKSAPRDTIRNWLNNGSTLRYLEAWELKRNPNFKRAQMDPFRITLADGRDKIRIQEFINRTQAIGIVSKSGRYGGTFAHSDIAFEFASWMEPVFKLHVYEEFQRLRSEEFKRKKLHWNAGRELARLNYPIQTAAIQEVSNSLPEKKKGGAYASEADMINVLVFGITAKLWRIQNPEAKGNIRDVATADQNVLLANLESFNAQLIRKGASREARERALADMLDFQRGILNQKYLAE